MSHVSSLAKPNTTTDVTTPLLSWHDTPAKETILAFIADVTDPTSRRFVPVPERIAVFDNDGTLWCERPLYAQFAFVFDLLAEKARQEPALQHQHPYRAAISGDMAWLHGYLSNSTLPAFISMVLEATARHKLSSSCEQRPG